MNMLNLKKKIILLFIILFLNNLGYALPSVSHFKIMCLDKNQKSQAKILENLLQNTHYKDRYKWLSKFDKFYNSPVVYSVYLGHIPITEVLIDVARKDNIPYYKFTAKNGSQILTIAIEHNNLPMVRLLLSNNYPLKTDEAKEYSSPLHEAAKNKNIPICHLLIDKYYISELIHMKDYNELTPINYLIKGKKEYFVVEILESFPVDTNNIPIDKDKKNYLDYAVKYRMHRLIALLLKQGFRDNSKDELWQSVRLSIKSCDLYEDDVEYSAINNKRKHSHSTRLNFFIKILTCNCKK